METKEVNITKDIKDFLKLYCEYAEGEVLELEQLYQSFLRFKAQKKSFVRFSVGKINFNRLVQTVFEDGFDFLEPNLEKDEKRWVFVKSHPRYSFINLKLKNLN